MGMIYDTFGRFAVEGRRESFYVHASYGLKPHECLLGDVKPGDCFRYATGSPPLQVVGQLIGRTLVKPADAAQDGPGAEQSARDVVIPTEGAPGYAPVDVTDDDHPLGQLWREYPHPEFEKADLGDLIAALEDYRKKLREGE